METLLHASSSPAYLSRRPPELKINGRGSHLKSSVGFSLGFKGSKPISLIAKAKKKDKENDHSFMPKPDEATGPFPEAVLLKEKKVQEDGRLLPEFADDEEKELFEFLDLQLQSDLNVERMRHYEVVYLVHENHAEEIESVNEKIKEFLKEKKGVVWRFSDWGMRRLAYKIQKANYAHYILMNFEIEAKYINDFKTMLDKDERVIRHLVIKRDEAITEDCPPPPEFRSLRSGFEDDDEEEEDDDEEYEDDEEFEDEEFDDEEDGVIVVDEDDDEGEVAFESDHENSAAGRENRKTVKSGR